MNCGHFAEHCGQLGSHSIFITNQIKIDIHIETHIVINYFGHLSVITLVMMKLH